MINIITTDKVNEFSPDFKTIFLAGPTSRKGEDIWRLGFVDIFKTLYKGNGVNIIIPEPFTNDYSWQVEFEHNFLTKSDVVVFWVPRNFNKQHYALTTNIEFGFFTSPFLIDRPTIVYGRPDGSDNNRYLDYCYEKFYNKAPHNEISELIEEVISIL